MDTLIEGRDCEVQGSYCGYMGNGRVSEKVMYVGMEEIDRQPWYVFSRAFIGGDGKPGFQRFRVPANESQMLHEDYLFTSYVRIRTVRPEIKHSELVIDFMKKAKELYAQRKDIPDNQLLVGRLEELIELVISEPVLDD
jgi:hypothetical protein